MSLGDGSFFASGIGLELPHLFLYNIPNSPKVPYERKKEMKKVRNIVTIVCALAAAAALWMQAGPQFLKFQGGAVPLGPEDDPAQAQGEYISREVAYPVAAYVAEYYSGDPDRPKDYGYVVYDAERKSFFCIKESDQRDGDYASLLYNLGLMAELRATKDMTPAVVEGSLELMDQADIDRALAALEESEIVSLYYEMRNDRSYYESYADAYYGDEYGKVLEEMGQVLYDGAAQTQWYCIESGSVNGVVILDMWICILAAGLSALIALGSLISLFTGGKAGKGDRPADTASAMERLLYEQRDWVEEWCQYCLGRASRSAYISVAIWVVLMGALGFFIKMPTQKIFVFYLPGRAHSALYIMGAEGPVQAEEDTEAHGEAYPEGIPCSGGPGGVRGGFPEGRGGMGVPGAEEGLHALWAAGRPVLERLLGPWSPYHSGCVEAGPGGAGDGFRFRAQRQGAGVLRVLCGQVLLPGHCPLGQCG